MQTVQPGLPVWRQIVNAILGGIAGVVSLFPLTLLLGGTAELVLWALNLRLNTNQDDYLLLYACLIPAAILCPILGFAAGRVGYRRAKHFKIRSAVRYALGGGVLGAVVIGAILNVYIYYGWIAR